jgi:hypothetical protein
MSDIVEQVRKNGLADTVMIIHGKKWKKLISEWMSFCLFYEFMLRK